MVKKIDFKCLWIFYALDVQQSSNFKKTKSDTTTNNKPIHFQLYQCNIISNSIQHKTHKQTQTDGEIEIHEICQFHVNGFRLTLNRENEEELKA